MQFLRLLSAITPEIFLFTLRGATPYSGTHATADTTMYKLIKNQNTTVGHKTQHKNSFVRQNQTTQRMQATRKFSFNVVPLLYFSLVSPVF